MTLEVHAYRIERGMYRNRALLDLAAKLETCAHCGRWTGEGCLAPAHSNLGEHGKGKGLKAHDCFWAALCDRCHKWFDNQGGLGKDPTGMYENTAADKRVAFLRAMARTWLELWRRGRLRVNTKGA